jgi:hypothetical protein
MRFAISHPISLSRYVVKKFGRKGQNRSQIHWKQESWDLVGKPDLGTAARKPDEEIITGME